MPDFQRDPAILKRRRIRQGALAVIALVLVIGVSIALARMEPAAPTVERAVVLIDTVKRGSIVRQVRGLGTLVPEETRVLLAPVDGQVERVLLRPGAQLRPDTVILELSNQQLEQDVYNARLALLSAQANYDNLKITIQNEILQAQANLAQLESNFELARMEAEANEDLHKQDLVSNLVLTQSQQRRTAALRNLDTERARMASQQESHNARLRVQQSSVDQTRAALELQERRLAWLRVTPGIAGVLQQLTAEVGTRVGTGTTLARITDPTRLKARLRIAETQARDVEVGQSATVDPRQQSGVVAGVVSHKDPAAESGTVWVEITLTEALPRGAVPDLSVDGTIQLERADNVLKIGRPSIGQERSTIGLFRLDATGHAVRTQVSLGVSSVSEIQVTEGLEEGDEVVLSDMSSWDAFDRVRLR